MDAVSLHGWLPSRIKIYQFAMSEESDACGGFGMQLVVCGRARGERPKQLKITQGTESPETRGELVRDVGGKPQGAVACVLDFRVYANGNYWTTTGWEDYLVPDFNQGFGRGERWVAGDSCGRGEGTGAAVD